MTTSDVERAKQALEYTDKIEFPVDLGRKLRRISKRYPIESGKCEKCSYEIHRLLQKHGYNAQIVRLELTVESRMPWLVTKDGRTVSHGPVGDVFHEIVVVNAKWAGDHGEYLVGGRIFNALTGPLGMSVAEYYALYYDDLFFDRYFLCLRQVS